MILQVGAGGFVPQIIEARARLAHAEGQTGAAAKLLREAHVEFQNIGATGHAERLAAELQRAEVPPDTGSVRMAPGRPRLPSSRITLG